MTKSEACRLGGLATKQNHDSGYYSKLSLMRKEYKGRPRSLTYSEMKAMEAQNESR